MDDVSLDEFVAQIPAAAEAFAAAVRDQSIQEPPVPWLRRRSVDSWWREFAAYRKYVDLEEVAQRMGVKVK